MMPERCTWVGTEQIYIDYHDTEWGVPEWDSRALWEKLVLDGFQAGLSWITILRKRDSFYEVFEEFDPERIARWSDDEIEVALKNPGIIRHRGKITGAVNSARLFLDIEAKQGFAPYLWSFVNREPIQNRWADHSQVPAATVESTDMSKALKKAGFTFVGPVICYAFMQAVGMVNDHTTNCFRQAEVRALSDP